MKKHKSLQIAPRLQSGVRREELYNRLPPEIKRGLRAIAKDENKSVSWVLEEVIILWFKLRRPQYRKPVLKVVASRGKRSHAA